MAFFPEYPIATPWEIERLGGAPSDPRSSSGMGRHNHRAAMEEPRQDLVIPVLRGALPPGCRGVTSATRRAAIEVAELRHGQLLISNDAIVVCDAAGAIQHDLSVCEFPEAVAEKVHRLAAIDEAPLISLDTVVLISDRFPAPNLCHFLHDQISRLALFRRAGVDIEQAHVVGPEMKEGYQREIAARAGVRRSLGTARVARVQARQLWVSSNGRGLQHPAHLAADWAIEHARGLLGGRGDGGTLKLYVSRDDATARKVANEEELFALLEPQGFKKVVASGLSYAAQVALFQQASHVVGAHGAGLAHVVLCPPGTRVLELFHPLYGTGAYAQLSLACGLAYTAGIGRDAVSDAPELNDPALRQDAAGLFGERNLRVEPDLVREWLSLSPAMRAETG
jgi:capsular polysaccharide biosynthesis protein